MPQLFDYSGIGQNYLRDQALQQEIEQRKKSFPISNALANAQLQDYLRNQQDTAAIRQTAQQNKQMTVNPTPPQPDATGNMQLGQSGAPTQGENVAVALVKKYISLGKTDQAAKTLEDFTKPLIAAGDMEGAARLASKATGLPIVVHPSRKDIMLAPAGSIGYNLETGKTEFSNPKESTDTAAEVDRKEEMAWLAKNPGKTHLDWISAKSAASSKPSAEKDFSATDQAALAQGAQKLGIAVKDLTPEQQMSSLAEGRKMLSTMDPALLAATIAQRNAMGQSMQYRYSQFIYNPKTGEQQFVAPADAVAMTKEGWVKLDPNSIREAASATGVLHELADSVSDMKKYGPALIANRTKIALALRDPHGLTDAVISGMAQSGMPPDAINGLYAMKKIKEAILANRTIIGQIPVGSDLRSSIVTGVIPWTDAILSGNLGAYNSGLDSFVKQTRDAAGHHANRLKMYGQDIPDVFKPPSSPADTTGNVPDINKLRSQYNY
jgi:hypothetical protein